METKHKIGDTVYVFTDDRTLLITLITAVVFVPNTENNSLHIVYNVLNENGDNNISFYEDDIYNSEEEAKERIILVETKDYEKRKAELNGEKFVEKEIDKKHIAVWQTAIHTRHVITLIGIAKIAKKIRNTLKQKEHENNKHTNTPRKKNYSRYGRKKGTKRGI